MLRRRLLYKKESGNITHLVFDKSISDPKNISGYGQGAILDIIAKMRRCLCKAVSSWQTTIENPQLLNWEQFGDDPSPDGWRIPTSAELGALDAAYRGSWITVNGVNGRYFGNSSGPFFPAAGRRNYLTGAVRDQGPYGFYWSSTTYNTTQGYSLYFYNSNVYPAGNSYYTYGFAVRCVRDISTTNYTPCPAGETRVGNLIWANSNLSGNKTFCQNETDYGCFFQWGQNLPLSSDPNVTANQLVHTKICYLDDYDSNNFPNGWKSNITDSVWTIKDPSPKGWRVPTSTELVALDAAYRGDWITVNGVNGRYFGSSSGPFFPAAGHRNTSGTASNQGTLGYYWSSAPSSSSAYGLLFFSTGVNPSDNNNRSSGFAIRCVRSTTTTDYIPCPAGEMQIGNLVWAKSNLKAAGEFCEKETDYGCYFQWGQNTAVSSDLNVSVTTITPILTGSEGDVMVYMPEFWYKYVPDPLGTGQSFGYDISLEPISGGVHIGESLLGAYKSRNVSSKLYSRSGVAPSVSISQTNNISYAKARGQGYNIIDFEQHSMIAFLFYAKYGNRDSQAVLGTGSAASSSQNGSTNILGNRDTEKTSVTHVSFAGIEGVHGCVSEWVSGVSISNRVWTVTDPNGTVRIIGTAPNSDDYIVEIAASNGPYFDLMPIIANGGNPSFYYSDYYEQSTSSRVMARSFHNTNVYGGVSYVNSNMTQSNTNLYIASRLSYRGTIIEESDPVVFKALPIIN